VTQIIGALILAAGAVYGVYKGAVYAVDRLVAQLSEERSLSEDRPEASTRLNIEITVRADSDPTTPFGEGEVAVFSPTKDGIAGWVELRELQGFPICHVDIAGRGAIGVIHGDECWLAERAWTSAGGRRRGARFACVA